MPVLTRLSEEEKFFQEAVKNFAATSIAPKVTTMDESECLDEQVIKECFDMGLMGIEIPEKYSGAAGSFFMSILAIEELAKVDPSVSVFVDVQNTLVNNILLRWGSEEQKQTFFPRLVSKEVGCFCLTEADSGSDAFSLIAKASDKGDHWLLDGKKIFITNANEASLFLFFANVNKDLGYKGITAFLLDRDMPGVSLGKKETKLGIRASSTCEVICDKVKVPKDRLIGEVGKGYKIAIETLNEGRIGIAAQMLGLAQGAFQGALKYSQERQQFGSPIRSFQGVQFDLAKMATEIEAVRLMVYNAARAKDNQQNFLKEAAMAKYFASEVAERVASKALEIYGGYGFVREFPAEKFYRDVKIGKIYEGTSNLQLQTIFKCLQKEEKL
jgi:alkylation response protein AidB-like acyl-CoA dehydrogenase